MTQKYECTNMYICSVLFLVNYIVYTSAFSKSIFVPNILF